jgi:hypothetical protein
MPGRRFDVDAASLLGGPPPAEPSSFGNSLRRQAERGRGTIVTPGPSAEAEVMGRLIREGRDRAGVRPEPEPAPTPAPPAPTDFGGGDRGAQRPLTDAERSALINADIRQRVSLKRRGYQSPTGNDLTANPLTHREGGDR